MFVKYTEQALLMFCKDLVSNGRTKIIRVYYPKFIKKKVKMERNTDRNVIVLLLRPYSSIAATEQRQPGIFIFIFPVKISTF